jgi:hypothetical protein
MLHHRKRLYDPASIVHDDDLLDRIGAGQPLKEAERADPLAVTLAAWRTALLPSVMVFPAQRQSVE